MSEKSRVKEIIMKPRTAAAILLAGLAFTGCGVTKSADKIPVGACGSHDYSKADPTSADISTSQAVSIAQQDVLTLQRRALKVGGSIDLPRYGDNQSGDGTVKEVTASQDNLRLNFDRSSFPDMPRVDHVDFPVHSGTTHVSEGAVTCYDSSDQQVVTNGTFTSLQQYVHQTASLDK